MAVGKGKLQKKLLHRRRRKKTIAGTHEPIVAIEVVVVPIEVDYPSPKLTVPVEVSHVAVAIGVLKNHAKYRLIHCPLNTLRAVFYLEPESPLILYTEYLLF